MALTRPAVQVDAAQFLGAMFADAGGDEWVTLFANVAGAKIIRWAPVTEAAALAAAAADIVGDVWFGVATRRARLAVGRGGAPDCSHLPALWVDIDIRTEGAHAADDLPKDRDEAWQLISDFPLQPTVVIDSGNGLQPYWVLEEPILAAEASELLARWGATWMSFAGHHGWHLDNVFDLARVMRVPGTWNHKSDPPRPVQVVHAEHRRYSLDDLEGYLLDAPQPPASAALRAVPYIGPERPGDAYNAITDPAVLLERTGCVLDHIDNGSGDRHYRAPHRADQRGATGLTVYAVDRHVTIYSETFARTWQMATQRPYDAFGLFTYLCHGGDWRAATKALSVAGYGTEQIDVAGLTFDPTPPDTSLERAHLVDWPAFWRAEHPEEEWAAYPVLPKGRSVALYAEAKVGKSSIILAAVAASATGRAIYGQTTIARPLDVLYLDYEMSEGDLMERMLQLGYGPEVDLSHLHYALLPSLPPLDSAAGAEAIVELVARTGSTIIVIDTFGRAVTGEENEADTVRAYYRYTASALKRLGLTQVRIDHAGKTAAKGQRGSSAKTEDVDLVWRAQRMENGALLTRTHSRMSWVPERIELVRIESDDDEIRWTLGTGSGVPAGTKEMIVILESLGIPANASSRKAAKVLRDAGQQGRNEVIRAAQRARANSWVRPLESAPQNLGAPLSDPRPNVIPIDGAQSTKDQVNVSAHPSAHLGAGERASGARCVSLTKGTHRPQPTENGPENDDLELF